MKFKLAIRSTMPDRDGRCNIKLAIGHKSMTTYISTPFSILPSEWDNGIVVNNPCAARINRFLAALHDKCTEVAYDIPFMDMSAKSVCAAVCERVTPFIGQWHCSRIF